MQTGRFHANLDGHRSQLLSERAAVRTDFFKALSKLFVPAIGATFVEVSIRTFLEQASAFLDKSTLRSIVEHQQVEPADT